MGLGFSGLGVKVPFKGVYKDYYKTTRSIIGV